MTNFYPFFSPQKSTAVRPDGACGQNSILDGGAASASEATSSEIWPWVVSVGRQEGARWEHECSGAVVGAKHILTAAHCTLEPG